MSRIIPPAIDVKSLQTTIINKFGPRRAYATEAPVTVKTPNPIPSKITKIFCLSPNDLNARNTNSAIVYGNNNVNRVTKSARRRYANNHITYSAPSIPSKYCKNYYPNQIVLVTNGSDCARKSERSCPE